MDLIEFNGEFDTYIQPGERLSSTVENVQYCRGDIISTLEDTINTVEDVQY